MVFANSVYCYSQIQLETSEILIIVPSRMPLYICFHLLYKETAFILLTFNWMICLWKSDKNDDQISITVNNIYVYRESFYCLTLPMCLMIRKFHSGLIVVISDRVSSANADVLPPLRQVKLGLRPTYNISETRSTWCRLYQIIQTLSGFSLEETTSVGTWKLSTCLHAFS